VCVCVCVCVVVTLGLQGIAALNIADGPSAEELAQQASLVCLV
jgi:hypothetical protein